ncbi:MAG: glycosyl hydrolase family 28-related protein [Armatimonadota bacterium]
MRDLVATIAIGVFATLILSSPAPLAKGIIFPNDPNAVIDVKRDLGAKGDGVHDDTEALQKGIHLSCGRQGTNTKVLYIPNGVYRVTRKLVVNYPEDGSGIGPWIYGQSRDGVIIKLDDGANTDAVLQTHPRNENPGSADWFMRTIYNLTIDVGDNPNTDGIRFFSNNTGIIKNVRIKGRGKIGINSFMNLNGPNIVQDTIVEGFEIGIRSAWMWGQTLSRVTIRNCKIGLEVEGNSVAVEDLVVENTPLPIHNKLPNDWFWWSGVLAIVGGRFVKGDPNGPAILNQGVLYARDITVSGFKLAIKSEPLRSEPRYAAGPKVAEFVSHDVKRLFDEAPLQAMRLPIKREPVVPWETNPNNWVCANDFGATYGDNKDDTEAIQRAIDFAAANRKTVVYLRGIGGGDPNWYTLNGEVYLRGTVRHIIGLGFGRIIAGEKGKFIVDDKSAPVVKFENIQAFGGRPPIVENRSKNRVVVLENCDLKVLGTGRGDIFVTNCPSHVEIRSKGQSLWARQLNPEGDSDVGLVINAGGNLWILGMKSEGRGVRIRTSDGGRTEVFGVFMYGFGTPPEDNRPIFDIDNAKMCVMGIREIAFNAPTYNVKVRERRSSEVREFRLKPNEHGWIGWALYSGW